MDTPLIKWTWETEEIFPSGSDWNTKDSECCCVFAGCVNIQLLWLVSEGRSTRLQQRNQSLPVDKMWRHRGAPCCSFHRNKKSAATRYWLVWVLQRVLLVPSYSYAANTLHTWFYKQNTTGHFSIKTKEKLIVSFNIDRWYLAPILWVSNLTKHLRPSKQSPSMTSLQCAGAVSPRGWINTPPTAWRTSASPSSSRTGRKIWTCWRPAGRRQNSGSTAWTSSLTTCWTSTASRTVSSILHRSGSYSKERVTFQSALFFGPTKVCGFVLS